MTRKPCRGWAKHEFGDAALGDARRTQRLVDMAAEAASKPAGKVTEVFAEGATREGAFRLLENEDVAPEAIALAAHRATANRCVGQEFVFVPVDGSSLHLVDRDGAKELGVVGARSKGALGVCVMSAIAVLGDGTPVGICGQRYWTRVERSGRKKEKKDTRKLEDKETRYWLEVMAHVRQVFAAEAPGTRPWFQLDRGGDAWPVLREALQPDELITVRASSNRRVNTDARRQRYLWDEVQRHEPLGTYALEVPPSPTRTPRIAAMELRACQVRLDLEDQRTKRHYDTPLWAVHAHEVSTTPEGEMPLEWLLLTNYPVEDFADAQLVLFAYTQRWRVEEFHKTWKTGACRVEDTQLRHRDHVLRWATILASVAMRILRITYLERTNPAAPASVEFSAAEIRASLLLARKPLKKPRGVAHTIGEIARCIAEIGGYTGKSSGGPPGPLVMARGLHRIEPVAQVIADGSLEM